ncbi:DM13 domain-containing protein [Aestuariicoccus sp. MJ-SS9]|uniref:DM13 domain-containing protein n=1 Tax=Aestuariicoccus sp. MJ-SS9 TaxID=3079855 RepID=UPI00290AAA60|nr:DM13 domain-containing protein [Aestuariicoccus sp. MJ-SS9]MDU8912788.1 DM13 domain-containing protein [Aestuariicoccus sp. MJ-SS9]
MRIIGFLTHGAALAVGFALGVYTLPILIAPDAPPAEMLQDSAERALFSGEFIRDLEGSDFLHWGEGAVSLTPTEIVHEGKLAPGPDYKLYLVNGFVEDEDGFAPLKADALLVGDVKTFGGFLLDLPQGVDLTAYDTVLVWCESFGEFITAAQYR